MADTFITQCPHCGTSFRVKEEHLAVANGSVRCGACLQVFSARNHVVEAPTRPAARAARPSAGKPASGSRPRPVPDRPQRPPPTDSGFTADDDDQADFLFSDDPAGDDEEFVFQDSEDDILADDSDADDGELGEFSDSFLNLGSQERQQRPPDPFEHETGSLHSSDFEEAAAGDDESWAESILEELEREGKGRSAQFEARDPGPARPESKQAAGAAPAAQLVRQLNHEIDLDFSAEGRRGWLRWLGGLLIVLLLVTLAGQLAWWQRDHYARLDQWRGLYQSACDLIGCTLPPQEDLGRIRTSNVLVRDHPVVDDVRLLDAILTNQAGFRQPFPRLIIQYSDINGERVADQAFAPDDYLRGEMTGIDLMPTNTRVYVSIPIREPGDSAVNYQLLLAPNPG